MEYKGHEPVPPNEATTIMEKYKRRIKEKGGSDGFK